MATITNLQSTDNGADSLSTINTNFDNLNTAKLEDITAENLSSLADITITSIASGEFLKWNGSAWINNTLAEAGIASTTSPTFATSITGSYLTASKILITDGSKNIISAPVATYPSLTELSYVKGVTSAIQTQLGNKAASGANSDITSLTGITGAVTIGQANGIDINPGSDTDADLITVGVTGTPKLWWDESLNSFDLFNGDLQLRQTGRVDLNLYRENTLADDTEIGIVAFRAKNDAGNRTTYSNFLSKVVQDNNGAERGNLAFGVMNNGTFENNKLVINYDGSIKFSDVYSDTVGGTNRDLFIDNTGLIGYVSSSIRHKENINDLNATKIYGLRPVSFNYKKDKNKGFGLIAEEVEKIMPELVSYDDEGRPETVQYSQLIPFLLKEIQELKKHLNN